jgi:hypothetical protein
LRPHCCSIQTSEQRYALCSMHSSQRIASATVAAKDLGRRSDLRSSVSHRYSPHRRRDALLASRSRELLQPVPSPRTFCLCQPSFSRFPLAEKRDFRPLLTEATQNRQNRARTFARVQKLFLRFVDSDDFDDHRVRPLGRPGAARPSTPGAETWIPRVVQQRDPINSLRHQEALLANAAFGISARAYFDTKGRRCVTPLIRSATRSVPHSPSMCVISHPFLRPLTRAPPRDAEPNHSESRGANTSRVSIHDLLQV